MSIFMMSIEDVVKYLKDECHLNFSENDIHQFIKLNLLLKENDEFYCFKTSYIKQWSAKFCDLVEFNMIYDFRTNQAEFS